MSSFQTIPAAHLNKNPFTLIGDDWMLITAEKEGKTNTMTAAWGGLGIMWGKQVAYIVIRNSRYTKEFVDAADTFSLSFFDEEYKSALKYLGTVSGRDEDKITNAKLTVLHNNNTPYFEEAGIVLICRKMFAQDVSKENFLSPDIDQTWYKDSDYHVLYIAEITDVLAKQIP